MWQKGKKEILMPQPQIDYQDKNSWSYYISTPVEETYSNRFTTKINKIQYAKHIHKP